MLAKLKSRNTLIEYINKSFITTLISFVICCQFENSKKILENSKNKKNSKNDMGMVLKTRFKKNPIFRPIKDAKAHHFIDALYPKTVLLRNVNKSTFGKKRVFENFVTVIYQSARYKDAFYFVEAEKLKEAEAFFCLTEKNPKFYAYLISINDNNKFLQLVNKTGPGYANKAGSYSADTKWHSLNYFYNKKNGYLMLPKERVQKAIDNVPEQSNVKQSNWCCGPNSGLRSLYLLGRTWKHSWNTWCDDCPSSLSGIQSVAVVPRTIFASLFSFILLPVSIVANGSIEVGYRRTFEMIEEVSGLMEENWVGPDPEQLAHYLNEKLVIYKSFFSGYSGQLAYEKAIVSDINLGYPRIILLIDGTFSMHYVNIIGYKPDKKYGPQYLGEVVILDTSGMVGYMSDSNLKYRMNSDGYALGILDNAYNTIEFSLK